MTTSYDTPGVNLAHGQDSPPRVASPVTVAGPPHRLGR